MHPLFIYDAGLEGKKARAQGGTALEIKIARVIEGNACAILLRGQASECRDCLLVACRTWPVALL